MIGGAPCYIPVTGDPGDFALLTSPDARPGYASIAPPDHPNEIAARFFTEVPFYRPVSHASKVRALTVYVHRGHCSCHDIGSPRKAVL
jgi:hypothetical protein